MCNFEFVLWGLNEIVLIKTCPCSVSVSCSWYWDIFNGSHYGFWITTEDDPKTQPPPPQIHWFFVPSVFIFSESRMCSLLSCECFWKPLACFLPEWGLDSSGFLIAVCFWLQPDGIRLQSGTEDWYSDCDSDQIGTITGHQASSIWQLVTWGTFEP